jgi:hypothetical protein
VNKKASGLIDTILHQHSWLPSTKAADLAASDLFVLQSQLAPIKRHPSGKIRSLQEIVTQEIGVTGDGQIRLANLVNTILLRSRKKC